MSVDPARETWLAFFHHENSLTTPGFQLEEAARLDGVMADGGWLAGEAKNGERRKEMQRS